MTTTLETRNIVPTTEATRLIPVPKWKNYHDWPSTGGLRHLIFNEQTNGFKNVIKRAGKRILIDEKAFFNWVNQKDQGVI
jgi:hypothetical protein